MASSRFDSSGESTYRWYRDTEPKLTPLGCSLPPQVFLWFHLWNAIDKPVRRAVIGLSLLSDRGCLLDWETRKSEMDALYQALDQAWSQALAREDGLREYRRALRDWKRRKNVLLPSRTDHLIRPGGLVETDLGWLAGVTTRASRRRVRVRLEEIGAIERRTAPGRQPRFLPRTEPTRVVEHEDAVRSMRESGELVMRTARSTEGSRERHFGSRPPSVYLSGESWASLRLAYGAYIVGLEVPPSVARFFTVRLTPLIRSLGETELGRTKEKGVYRWLSRMRQGGAPVALVIRLQ